MRTNKEGEQKGSTFLKRNVAQTTGFKAEFRWRREDPPAAAKV